MAPVMFAMKNRVFWLSVRGARLWVLFTVSMGIVITSVLFHVRRSWEQQELSDAFLFGTHTLNSLINREFDLYFEVLESLGRLHSVGDNVNAAAFNEFVSKGLLYHQYILGTFGWAPLVPGSQRGMYEAAMRSAGNPDYAMVEWREDRLRPVGPRELFYPVSYITPTNQATVRIGYDLASEPEFAAALARSREQGDVVATPHPEHASGRLGNARLVVFPIYGAVDTDAPPRQRHEEYRGTVFALLDPRRILDEVFQHFSVQGMNVAIYEEGMDGARRVVFTFGLEEDDPADTGLEFVSAIQLPGLAWKLVCVPTRAFVHQYRTWLPWGILVVGFGFTTMFSTYIALLAGRAQHIEQTVRDRTAELITANRKLKRSVDERRRLEKEILDVSTLEKQRIGQDLHDSLAQELTGIGLLSRALAQELKDKKLPEADSAEKISSFMKEARTMVRRIARGLMPVEMDAEGLGDALRRLADDAAAKFGLPCVFNEEEPSRVRDDAVAIHLYHIAQEAINNAARHASPSFIDIGLKTDDGRGELTVTNDGEGMPDETSDGEGMGLRTMRYRAEMIGGSLQIIAHPEGGTIIQCIFDNSRRA
ncbi:MAG: hypothetical protein EOM20_10050 [Spartobacteria bacterium]|nr:hypothetical protein [Spartobacteria bacterium]